MNRFKPFTDLIEVYEKETEHTKELMFKMLDINATEEEIKYLYWETDISIPFLAAKIGTIYSSTEFKEKIGFKEIRVTCPTCGETRTVKVTTRSELLIYDNEKEKNEYVRNCYDCRTYILNKRRNSNGEE